MTLRLTLAERVLTKARFRCDDERGGALVKDEPVVVHCYTTPADIENSGNLAELGEFCRRMGRDARQERSAWSTATSTSPFGTSQRSSR